METNVDKPPKMETIACTSAPVTNGSVGRLLNLGETPPAGSITSNTPEGIMVFANKEERKMYYRQQSEARIPEPHATHRKLTKEIWVNSSNKQEREIMLEEVVHQIVGAAENPYRAILDLHTNACDYSINNQDRLASLLLVCFEKWLKKRDDQRQLEGKFLELELKKEAFGVATKVTTASMAKIFEIFCIFIPGDDGVMEVEPYLEDFIETQITELCNDLKFKEALEVVSHIGWHEKFDIELFLIPCTLLDKRQLVEEFLKKSRKHLEKYIRWLDNLLPLTRLEVEERFSSFKQKKIMNLPVEQFLDKTLEKHIRRLLLTYRLGELYAPNFAKSRTQGQIRYQITTYMEHDRSSDGRFKYYTGLYGNIKDSERMQRYALIYLINKGHGEEALWWTLMLNAETESWLPRELTQSMRLNPGLVKQKRVEVERFRASLQERNDEAIPETLHGDYKIKLVDENNVDLFRKLPELLFQEPLIGIDAEWKQGITSDTVALMQIACSECVYLIDFITLLPCRTANEWRAFLVALLTGPGVKLGFDFGQDLKHLFDTFPNMNDLKDRLKNIVCLKQLTNNILDLDEEVIDVHDPTKINQQFETYTTTDGETVTERNFSLAILYKKSVGKSLDKTEQQSHWTHRPLNPKQVRYAAQDAFCLMEIYFDLQRRTEASEKIKAHNTTFDNLLLDCNPWAMTKKKKRERREVDDLEEMERLVQEMNSYITSENHPLRGCGELKIITDNMLTALGKYLRRMGVDVLLSNAKNDAFLLAKRHADRILISTGKNYMQMSQMPHLAGRVFRVPYGISHPPIEQAILLFKEFKVMPHRNDIFSRCMNCNERAFVLVPRPVLHFVYHFCHEIRGVYAREEDFILEEWLTKLSDLPAEKFGGVGAKVDFIHPPYKMIAKCENGEIHLGAGMVHSSNGMGPVRIEVQKYPLNVYVTPEDRFFYVCGGCGHLYWDGYQRRNYLETAGAHILSQLEESDHGQSPTNA